MGDAIYKPLIDDMTWSYSRIGSYNNCPYKFYLEYIMGCKSEDMFYSSYGSFIHKLIEQYYNKEITKPEMLMKFLTEFSSAVKGVRPSEKVVKNYIDAGREYLLGFKEFPYNMIAVEKRVDFKISEYKFVGYIDFLGEKDGDLYIVDNKSRSLKPRSGKAEPTANDKEIDKMLRQLYIYSSAIFQEYGVYPKALCFNCFKNGVFIEEQFDKQKYKEALEWAVSSIEEIANTEDFEPNEDYFLCRYICGVRNHCIYNIESRK